MIKGRENKILFRKNNDIFCFTRKIIDEFRWEIGEEGYTCKLEKGQSIFVDLGNEYNSPWQPSANFFDL